MMKPSQSKTLNEDALENEAISLIKMEYTSLLNLYTHTENTIFSVFNFYLTLLSAVVGAIVVLIQLNNTNLLNAFPSICGLLVLMVLIGVIMQDAIVNKNIDLSTYALGINLLKYRLFRHYPQEMPNVFFMNNFWANVYPVNQKRTDSVASIHKRFWWFFPLGTHQLFIAVIDSLALSALVILAVHLLGTGIAIQNIGIASILIFGISFEIHVIYARFKHQRGIQNIVTANGSEIAWITDDVTAKSSTSP